MTRALQPTQALNTSNLSHPSAARRVMQAMIESTYLHEPGTKVFIPNRKGRTMLVLETYSLDGAHKIRFLNPVTLDDVTAQVRAALKVYRHENRA